MEPETIPWHPFYVFRFMEISITEMLAKTLIIEISVRCCPW